MVGEKPCEVHTYRLDDMERRMSRIEKFIISTLVMFALVSVSNIFLLIRLPDKIASYDHASRVQSHQ